MYYNLFKTRQKSSSEYSGINQIKRESDISRQPEIDDEFDMTDYCKQKLLDIIQDSLNDTIPTNTELDIILNTSITLLEKLSLILYKVAPCFPPHYEIFKMYKDGYLLFIYTKLKPFLNEDFLYFV